MLKHTLRTLLTAVVAAGPLAACATLNVKSDVNPALIGQVRCNTFAWAGSFRGDSALRATVANPLNEDRLRAAIATHLPIQAAPGYADCLIGYGIGSTTVVQGWYGGGPYGYGYGWPYYGWGWTGPYVYREGIIAVDLYDARSGQALWHASVEQSLDGLTGAEAAKRIDAAVAAIFTKYPG
jgi:Domain of unknown function (DUF4136)